MQRRERSLVPVGMATILPHTAQRVRHLEETLMGSLGRWGYREIIPPTFEYLDVLSAGLEPDVIEKCYKFADRTTGRILLLRPDVTAQIARIVAMGMVGRNVPLRLCYRTTVFRYEPEHAGRDRELFQVGAELIGLDDLTTDGEIIALMVECLKQLGLPTFKISLGHVGFFKALLAKSGMSLDGQKRAEQAAARKDLPRLEEILSAERVSGKQARAILEAPGLYGRDEVLERGRVLAGRNRQLLATLDRLTQVYRLLVSAGMRDHLLLDLGEFRGFDYYDGVVFDVFAGGVGCELGGGGRYNHLIGRFGRDLPSTGFAFDVDRLFRAMECLEGGLPHSRVDFLIAAPVARSDRLFQVSQLLRNAGFRVVQRTLRATGSAEIRSLVEEGRVQGASVVAILGGPRVAPDEALVVAVSSAAPCQAGPDTMVGKRVKVKDLPNLLAVGPGGITPSAIKVDAHARSVRT
ncbi:MAG TPA: ATP phosphoribosyltransferase regulatory subunit [Candidatus Binatia bacterium]|nr:ATP phosphoribosyltransferase regulatory subunit [Candidatus Binatia bacterium]